MTPRILAAIILGKGPSIVLPSTSNLSESEQLNAIPCSTYASYNREFYNGTCARRAFKLDTCIARLLQSLLNWNSPMHLSLL